MTTAMLRDRRAMTVSTLVAVGIAIACLGSAPPRMAAAEPTCTASPDNAVHWVRLSSLKERASLDRWCAGVGPSVSQEASHAAGALTTPFAVVAWNTHVGAADLGAFVADLRAGRLTSRPVQGFVLLLQEAYRAGDAVPSRDGVEWASAVLGAGGDASRVEAVTAALTLGLSSVYVPSMRNGAPRATTEDRGNAILSSVRLSSVSALELPLERQRRVAIAATVMVDNGAGGTTPLRLVCTHFTNMVMHHAWLLSESGRLRQARALSAALPPDGPLIVGGDFNSWFGFRDAAYRELAGRLAPAAVEDRRATFGPMRLDHLLFRLPEGLHAEVRRAERKYGSDHYPLVALIERR